ncbi:MAG TPA: glycosyltransferase [Polyangiaceae bacterium]|jgi:glycosyltransferase involved in cell wall biosynthesis
MKATVVIPTYNRAERLAQLLTCLTTQGDALAQVVVCDDGSSDRTAAVAREFEDRLPLAYVWQENLGFRAGQARNLGIARSVGDVVIFVDDDVLVASDFVAEHLAAHAGGAPRVAVGYRSRAFLDGPPVTPIAWEDYEDAEPDDRVIDIGARGEGITKHPTPWLFVYSCNFSVTRTAEMPRFDESFVGWGMEDIEYGYRLQKSGYEVVAARGARVLHAEDTHPRDPFRCEVRTLEPTYDSYVRNAIHFMDKYPDDAVLAARIRTDLRWYVRDEARGCWVKNGHANDIEQVLTHHRRERAEQSP